MRLSPAHTLALILGLALVAPACGDDEPGDDDDIVEPDAAVGTPDAAPTPIPATVWHLGADPNTNAWTVTIVDVADPTNVLDSFEVEDLATLSGPAEQGGNGAGPSWGDAIPNTDHTRVFANAPSVDKVAVFDVETRTLEAILDVGGRPLHLWNPNHGSEIWSHADGPGAFYVINQQTLAVSDPLVAALDDAGHGKLLYSEELGTKYFATNTNNPGAFPIDGAAQTVGGIITLCDLPCEDDPKTKEDESLLTCGSTHDKAYNPTMNYAVFQCSGDARGNYAFVNATTNAVVQDMVPMGGGIAHTPGNEYILVLSGEDVSIWDTGATGHNGVAFDSTVVVADGPSARGTMFAENGDGDWEAWIPQTSGTKLAVVNLTTNDITLLEIGTLTAPPGASHFSRRAEISGGYFFTYNDQGVVQIDLATQEVTQGPATAALTSRAVFVDPEGQQ